MEPYNTEFHGFLNRITQGKHNAEYLLEKCNNCQCCADHQQNRPTEYTAKSTQ